MENYRKIKTRQEEAAELSPTQIDQTIPLIKVNANGKVKNYVNAGTKYLQNEREIFVCGIGAAINKAVSVAEVIARNHKATLKTIIFEVKEVDVWDPISGELDSLEITRHLPAIRLQIILQDVVVHRGT